MTPNNESELDEPLLRVSIMPFTTKLFVCSIILTGGALSPAGPSQIGLEMHWNS